MRDHKTGNAGEIWAVKCSSNGSCFSKWMSIECYKQARFPIGRIHEVMRKPAEKSV